MEIDVPYCFRGFLAFRETPFVKRLIKKKMKYLFLFDFFQLLLKYLKKNGILYTE